SMDLRAKPRCLTHWWCDGKHESMLCHKLPVEQHQRTNPRNKKQRRLAITSQDRGQTWPASSVTAVGSERAQTLTNKSTNRTPCDTDKWLAGAQKKTQRHCKSDQVKVNK